PVYFRDLIREGAKLGMNVYLFSNEDIMPESKKIRGFVPNSGKGWKTREFPWPDVVIDRRRSNWTGQFRRFRKKKWLRYANHKFTLKSKATELFAQSDAVKKWI